ncbi:MULTISPECIES: SIR2 family protein [unclassified Mesorhizobium]|uniref:SIR2 family protein n=1 Tax=unclassified Mesorhizobium TaxID=325217 RepID=UPI00333C5207
MRHEKFIEEYVQALQQENAGLFVGAGLSTSAGYPSWKDLVHDLAEDIGLDVNLETDLPGVVQYFLNSAGRKRTRLASLISKEIGIDKRIPEILHTLARFPLKHIWTTNYDELLERAWREQRLFLEVNTTKQNLVINNPAAHAQLYKMHGTVGNPSDVVIAKGDYEGYRRERGEFLNLLHSHLVSRRMLFLGFSFTDPNLSQLFTLIRDSFGDMPPEHYAVVKRPQRGDFAGRGAKARFAYADRRHKLWVKDLENYGIQCIEVDAWAELDELMKAVEQRLAAASVMVSGSCPEVLPEGEPDYRRKIEAVAQGVGKFLIHENYRIVSGFGLVVGSATLSGALDELYRDVAPNLERRLFLRPFPQLIPPGQDRQEFYRRYREDLVRQAGACVFICGAKIDGNSVVVADGVIAEYDILKALGRTPIPIGATGGAAQKIWEAVNANFPAVFGTMPRRSFDILNDATAVPEQLIKAVGDILKWVRKNGRVI